MSAIRSKGNRTTEVVFRMELVRLGIRGWICHPENIAGKPDMYFSKAQIAVFLDGCFWHGCHRCGHIPRTNSLFWATKIRRNRERDRRNSKLLRGQGISVIRAWEHSLQRPRTLALVLRRITEATGR